MNSALTDGYTYTRINHPACILRPQKLHHRISYQGFQLWSPLNSFTNERMSFLSEWHVAPTYTRITFDLHSLSLP